MHYKLQTARYTQCVHVETSEHATPSSRHWGESSTKWHSLVCQTNGHPLQTRPMSFILYFYNVNNHEGSRSAISWMPVSRRHALGKVITSLLLDFSAYETIIFVWHEHLAVGSLDAVLICSCTTRLLCCVYLVSTDAHFVVALDSSKRFRLHTPSVIGCR